MIQTINIGDKEVRLDNNIGWTIEYRDQFNTDILPTLMPMAAALMSMLTGIVEATDNLDNLDLEDLVEVSKNGTVLDALVKLSTFEFNDFINITWAMAKCADETIPEPKKWVREFEVFPIDTIGPAVFNLAIQGVVSGKNWERLQSSLKELKPKMTKKNQ